MTRTYTETLAKPAFHGRINLYYSGLYKIFSKNFKNSLNVNEI